MRITFLGAADTVTGSRHLVELGGQRILLDCGMFQGFKLFRERNWAEDGLRPSEIDAVILSHAHLDHSGWLPLLVKRGYRGPIYASPATRDLAGVLLLDAAKLQEEDAQRANRYGYSKHEKALPLYTRQDAQRAIAKIQAVPTGRGFAVGDVEALLTPVGHLLGACAVTLRLRQEVLAYSGDLGRSQDLLMPPPQTLPRADVLLIESTYGNRAHPAEDGTQVLADIINATVRNGGSVLLPAFAVGRAQVLLVVLQRLKSRGDIAHDLPVFLDSPMAIQATDLYRHHRKLLRISNAEAQAMCDGVRMIATAQQSMRLTRHRFPCVIISASGMATGGRVLHHLKAMAPEPRHHIVFPGFQVGGSRGARLVAGASEVKIHGEYIPVRAPVTHLEGFSGHADSDELVAWARALREPPRQTFVVHGDPDASDALRVRLKDELGWAARVPQHRETVEA
jgi:metallo-beta-lactamase family protein